jgi:hypothetical protein
VFQSEVVGVAGQANGAPEADPGNGDLPGVVEGGVVGDQPEGSDLMDLKEAIAVGLDEVEAATVVKVLEEAAEDAGQEAGVLPLAVIAVAGFMGGEVGGEVVPGGVFGELPEDGFEDEAGVGGGAAAARGGWGEEGLEKGPLFVGEEHGIFEEKNVLAKMLKIPFRAKGHFGAAGAL